MFYRVFLLVALNLAFTPLWPKYSMSRLTATPPSSKIPQAVGQMVPARLSLQAVRGNPACAAG